MVERKTKSLERASGKRSVNQVELTLEVRWINLAWQDQMKAKLINQESKAIATHPLSHITKSDRAAGPTGEAWQAVVFFDGCCYSKFFTFFSSWSLYSESLLHTSTQSYSTSPARSLVTLLWLRSEQECTQTPDNHSITLSFGNSGSIQKTCTFLTSLNQ